MMNSYIMLTFLLLILPLTTINISANHQCERDSFEYEFGPKWVPYVQICFPNEEKTVFMNEEIPFYFLTLVEERAQDIRLFIVHESHIGFFKEGHEDYERVLKERQEAGLKEDHIYGLSDNKHIFTIDLKDAEFYNYGCNQILGPDGQTMIDAPECKYPYDIEEKLRFTIPGIYYYVVKMETMEGKILTDPREVPVFEVADLAKKVTIESMSKENNEPTVVENNSKNESESITDNQYFIGITTGLFVTGIGAGVTLFIRKYRKQKLINNSEFLLEQKTSNHQFTEEVKNDESFDETIILEEGEDQIYSYELDEYDKIVGKIKSDQPINVYVVSNYGLRLYKKDADFNFEDGGERIKQIKINFETYRGGPWHVIIINEESDRAEIEVYLNRE